MPSLTTSSLLNSFFLFTFLYHGVTISGHVHTTISIGAILDMNSRIGKEEKLSMQIAIERFNNASSNQQHKLVLHVSHSSGDPLQASNAANELIKKKQVEAIIGVETWKEAALVTEIANRAQVPFLSLAAPSINPPLISLKWPFLIRMAKNEYEQLQCITSIVRSYGWRKIVAIYEEDGYNTESGILSLLSGALQAVGTKIEHQLVFPPFSTLSKPHTFIQQELKILESKQSRVFIVLRSSLELATHVLLQAKQTGLMGKDSVWITTDSVTNLLDTVNSTVMASITGTIGIKTHFAETSPPFLSFSTEFRNLFRSIYPEEDKFEPGFYALRAYDTVSAVALALDKSAKNSFIINSQTLLKNILSSNFHGLTGKIQFKNKELSGLATYAIINVVGKCYTELKFWSLDHEFTNTVSKKDKTDGDGDTKKVLGGRVYWPGGLERDPLGCAMPSDAKPMVIGVPGQTSFEKFVHVKHGNPTGFCIDLFKKAVKLLNYELPHTFQIYHGSYNDLVEGVYHKDFDAVVGDVTILANRSDYVEFTQPYEESGLTMVVPVKSEGRDWLFLRPFKGKMWLVVAIVFAYTMFVVWFMEHRSNPEFRGSWRNQLCIAMSFTFSTLFFAHKEALRSNFTRIVVVVWLFVVFIVISSYQASLTSMLTLQRLEPTVNDIETLRRSNSQVGCDGDSFVRRYLEEVLHFHPDNIVNVKSEYDYPGEFKSGRIKAAFLELPYARVFLTTYCKEYQVVGPTFRFGGLGFVFPKGSPLAIDFSKAFMKLSEDGTLDELERFWFRPSTECSTFESERKNQSLSLSNFWTLFLITGLTSTIMLILYMAHLCAKPRQHYVGTTSHRTSNSFWSDIKRFGTYLNDGRFHPSQRDTSSSVQVRNNVEISISQNGEIRSEYTNPGHPQSTPPVLEMGLGGSQTQRRVLRPATSFPALDKRVLGFPFDDPNLQLIPKSA